MTEQQAVLDILKAIQSGYPQLVGNFAIIWWARMIDLRNKDHAARLDRHEARLTASETAQQKWDVRQARMEENISSMKLTLDRIYAQVSDQNRAQTR
ncbi:hypothetical protein [Paracoccus aminophilus]|uniref:Uncharacterized protein n=1 Tax=Paracoccus aminophilus JCM 7686 TaxID=1367847 RepID=S5XPN9_PARAH|nr:hypothetical protein [Paracoccus aminophilus]AGT09309.1 hypothetical protein JCM7686_2231 [Paracoccus aminophilus JCM 7686]